MTGLRKFIPHPPKVAPHLHIEGALEPETMLDPARRSGVALPCASVAVQHPCLDEIAVVAAQ
jgi:adenosine deaminase